ncbi:MAG TPA: NAD(P)-dependent oxidoreductase [Clostridia bacterium]|mgnify:CR=1 FL=1|nr:NAD(P)-dependent oxidoreductase [Clostridia bacterium]
MKVGIIGLGSMGLGFAKNLIAKGYSVSGFDINSERMEMLAALGGNACKSPADVGAASDAVILMVFNDANIRTVLYGEGPLLSTLTPGKVLLVTCTVGDAIINEVLPDLTSRGIRVLDTPLMGSCEEAENGSIHIIVAAEKTDFEFAKPLLLDMGSELYFMGETPGSGQLAKTCLQALFSLTFETAFEVISLAKKAGLNMDEVHRLFKNSPSSSVLFHITEENIMNRAFTGTNNPLSILEKDINLVLKLSARYGLKLGACEGTAKIFGEAMKLYASEDIFAAVKVVEND